MIDVWSRYIDDLKEFHHKTEAVIDEVQCWGCLNPA